MSDTTKIEWCDSTHNHWIGCTKVSPACDNCYAAVSTPSRTLGITWGAKEARHLTTEANRNKPKKWEKEHEAFFAQHGRRRRVFCSSLSDVFDNEVPDVWRLDLFKLIAATPNLDWLILTKRIGNVSKMLGDYKTVPLLPNIWLGATICNQDEADRDIPKLLAVPAARRFLSMEPLLGPVNLTDVPMPESGHGHHEFSPIITGNALKRADWQKPRIDWVIVGGESCPGARPMHPDWARSLRDQCAAAGVPFLFKQWGEFDLSYDRDRDDPDFRKCNRVDKQPGRWVNLVGGHGFNGERVHYAHKVGKKAAGRLLDGVEHNGFPA